MIYNLSQTLSRYPNCNGTFISFPYINLLENAEFPEEHETNRTCPSVIYFALDLNAHLLKGEFFSSAELGPLLKGFMRKRGLINIRKDRTLSLLKKRLRSKPVCRIKNVLDALYPFQKSIMSLAGGFDHWDGFSRTKGIKYSADYPDIICSYCFYSIQNLNEFEAPDWIIFAIKQRGVTLANSSLWYSHADRPIIAKVLGCLLKPGDLVVMESGKDSFCRSKVQDSGARLYFTGSDVYGIDVDNLEELCRYEKVKAVLIPHFRNDFLYRCMSGERRKRLLRLSRKYKFVVLHME